MTMPKHLKANWDNHCHFAHPNYYSPHPFFLLFETINIELQSNENNSSNKLCVIVHLRMPPSSFLDKLKKENLCVCEKNANKITNLCGLICKG